MRKTFLRIQGINGGSLPVWQSMDAMIEYRISFVQANSYQHSGSRDTANYWETGMDLLYALVREDDVAMIHLLNDGCVIRDAAGFKWWRWSNDLIPF